MKITYIHITILAYFLTDILKWQALWGKEKYLLKVISATKVILAINLPMVCN